MLAVEVVRERPRGSLRGKIMIETEVRATASGDPADTLEDLRLQRRKLRLEQRLERARRRAEQRSQKAPDFRPFMKFLKNVVDDTGDLIDEVSVRMEERRKEEDALAAGQPGHAKRKAGP
jgi:hypothetical protein